VQVWRGISVLWAAWGKRRCSTLVLSLPHQTYCGSERDSEEVRVWRGSTVFWAAWGEKQCSTLVPPLSPQT
jgi:hypothetical protein